MLQRDVQILDDLVLLGNRVDQFLGDLVGIEVVQANPGKIHLAQLAQQLGQTALAVQVDTVLGNVLCNDDQFLDACARQCLCLIEQCIIVTAAILAAQLGDDAVCAGVRAALGNLKVCRVTRGQALTVAFQIGAVHRAEIRPLFTAAGRLDRLYNVLITARAADDVNLGQIALDLLAVALCQAAGDDQTLHFALLALGGLQNGLDRLGLGRLDKTAGVDNAHLSLVHIVYNLAACLTQSGEHVLGVNQILGTAERDQSNFRVHRHTPFSKTARRGPRGLSRALDSSILQLYRILRKMQPESKYWGIFSECTDFPVRFGRPT